MTGSLIRRGFRRATCAALLALVGCSTLSACSSPVELGVNTILTRAENAGGTSTVVDIDHAVAGPWTSLVIACRGASNEQLNSELGFSWSEAPSTSDPAFLAVMVFADRSHVVSSYSVGPDSDWYFVPCVTPPHDPGNTPDIVRVSRADARLTFDFDDSVRSHPYWFIDAKEMERLRQAQSD